MASPSGDALQFNNVVFHFVPNPQAPGLLAAMLVFAFCLGVLTLELVSNFFYDLSLLRRPGWREPIKASNRIAYFLCRYGAFVFLLLTVIYMNMPGNNCHAYAKAINVMWGIPLIFVDLIFVQRTLAVYGWDRRVGVPLGLLYTAYVGLCTYSVVEFGYGYRIPGSTFCAYQVLPTDVQPHSTVFIVYICTTIFLDSLVLLLTAHRLMEGGLANVFHLIVTKSTVLRSNKAARKAAGHDVGEVSLSGLLMRQGLGYFIVLEGARLAFLIVYYVLSSSTSYQVLVCAVLAMIGPVMAGMLFRQTAEAVKRTAIVSSFGRDGAVLSQGRSYRSSTGNGQAIYSPSLPISPRREQTQSLNPIFAQSPRKTSSVDDEDSAAAYYEEMGARPAGATTAATAHHQDIREADQRGLQVFVEEKTNVETMHMSPLGSHNSSRARQAPTGAHDDDDDDEGLPIHQRYTRTGVMPAFLGAHDGQTASPTPSTLSNSRAYFEDDVAFTPVLPTSERTQGPSVPHYDGYGSAR